MSGGVGIGSDRGDVIVAGSVLWRGDGVDGDLVKGELNSIICPVPPSRLWGRRRGTGIVSEGEMDGDLGRGVGVRGAVGVS